MGDLPDLPDLVLVGELVIEVVDHDKYGQFSGLPFDLLDLLCRCFPGDDILIVQRHFLHDTAGVLHGKELSIVGEGGYDHTVPFVNERSRHCLEPAACTGHDPGMVHIHKFCEVGMELRDPGLGDLVEPEWFAAGITR